MFYKKYLKKDDLNKDIIKVIYLLPNEHNLYLIFHSFTLIALKSRAKLKMLNVISLCFFKRKIHTSCRRLD